MQKEKSSSIIEEIVHEAIANQTDLYIHSINMGEVWYILARKIGSDKADVIVENLIDLGIQVIDTDWTLTKKAASYKLLGGISYADCFAAALASLKNAKLLTGDLEFERVKHEVEIIWLVR